MKGIKVSNEIDYNKLSDFIREFDSEYTKLDDELSELKGWIPPDEFATVEKLRTRAKELAILFVKMQLEIFDFDGEDLPLWL